MWDDWDLPKVQKLIHGMIPVVEKAGCELLEFNNHGHVKLKMPFRGNENHVGVMYAGSLWTLAEYSGLPLILSAFGMDFMDTFLPVVATFEIKFLKPVKEDMFVQYTMTPDELDTYQAQLVHDGRCKMLFRNKICDAKGNCYAETVGKYVMLKNPNPEQNKKAVMHKL